MAFVNHAVSCLSHCDPTKICYASRQPLPGRYSDSLIRSLRIGLDAQILVREFIWRQETAFPLSVGKEVMHVKVIEENIVYSYSLDQAIEDGYLVEIFKKRWKDLSGGKPIVA